MGAATAARRGRREPLRGGGQPLPERSCLKPSYLVYNVLTFYLKFLFMEVLVCSPSTPVDRKAMAL